jgi:Calcium binding
MPAGKHPIPKKPRSAPHPIGASVRVRRDIKDPGRGRSIGGWQGRVTGWDALTIEITWDSLTLKAMPAGVIDWCEVEGLVWSIMWLAPDEVQATEPRDQHADAAREKKALAQQHAWAFLGAEGPRIQTVLAGIYRKDDYRALKAWRALLQQRLDFPFFAVVDVGPPYGPIRPEAQVAVSDLHTVVDDSYGVLAELGGGPNGSVHPLSDLRVTDGKSPNFQPVHDYCVWFANR